MAPRCLLHLLQGFRQQLEVACVVQQASAAQQQVVVVAGETFKKPQQRGVVFALVVVAREFLRAQALDVPGVKVFVADQAQQRAIALAGGALAWARKVAAAANQGRAVAVLQPAVAVMHGIEQKQVAIKRRRFASRMPELHGRRANALGIGQQPGTVPIGRSACHHQAVGNAQHLEMRAPKTAQLEGAVGQFVVAQGTVAAKAAGIGFYGKKGCSALPERASSYIFRSKQLDVMGLLFLP